ncbi:MAG TPA: hypothetical protein VEU94_02490, partial [Terriglobales bacterium]|nr:hypothetical protein [Terriglobales bacterium]
LQHRRVTSRFKLHENVFQKIHLYPTCGGAEPVLSVAERFSPARRSEAPLVSASNPNRQARCARPPR